MLLGSLALALAVVLGIGCGVISALKQNSLVDYAAMSSRSSASRCRCS